MNQYDITRKLTGASEPLGESHTDSERFENLQETCDLVEDLIADIYRVAQQANRPEASIGKAGRYAKNFLKDIELL